MMRCYYAAYNAGLPEKLGELLDVDVVLTSALGTSRGRDAYLSTYRYMIDLFVDQMEPVEIVIDDALATVRIVDRLTARSDIPDFMGQALKKDQTITLNLVGRYSFKGGKISRIEIAQVG
jgi:hypothetical protein